MASKPETRFRASFRPRLNAVPVSWWESIQQKAINGTPDIIGVVNGHFVALELKASQAEVPTALQSVKIHRIRQAHGIGLFVYPENADTVLEYLKNLGEL